MKTLIAMMALSLLSQVASASDLIELKIVESANQGHFSDAGYSFGRMTADPEVHRGNVDVAFLTYEREGDVFRASTMGSDFNFIFDVGEMSCAEIESRYPENRKSRPLVWLAYTDIGNKMSWLKNAETHVPVKQGHCYLVYNSDEDGRVVALFQVKYHQPGKSVVLGEVEVLDRMLRN